MSDHIIDEHLDPTAEITLEAVKQRAVKGVAILTGRTFFLQLLSFTTWIFLGVFLEPDEFGVYIVVSAIVNFLRYFSDVGLAAALIQKKQKLTQADLRSTFTIQQILVLGLLLILFLASPFIKDYYSLSKNGMLLLYALGASLFLASLKTIPSVLLERELNFSKFVIPELLENLVYDVILVIFAWRGFGTLSFFYAVLSRGIIGVVAMYLLKPWKPGLALSKSSLKKLLKYGVPYQVNTLLATVKDDGMTIYLGGVIGQSAMGFLGWAQKWSQYPLRLFMDNVLKVTFPAFSRMQDDKIHLKRSVTRSIFFVCFLVFPSIVGFLILSPILVNIIPRYEKWEPALLPLAIVSINTIFAAATTQLTNLLNAIGKIKTTFKLMVMWTVLTWIFIPLLARNYGLVGAASGYALVGASSAVAIAIVYKIINFSLYRSILAPALGALVMGAACLTVRSILPSNIISVFILVLVGIATYMATMFVLAGSAIFIDAKRGLKAMFNRN
ncbi:oligosaccharide flippase family protein [Candidatus Woesebacteria bacterium]|nr:oligosaccharide flippase family protein [Candidatus Woesebacteria bacterium]